MIKPQACNIYAALLFAICILSSVFWLARIDIIEFELIPLIKEYWFDEQFKVNEWTFNLRSSIK